MIPEKDLKEKDICLYLVIVLDSWEAIGCKSRGSWKTAHKVNFKSYLLTLWWVGPFLSLVPPQKVLSLYLKTKLQAYPSHSQLPKCKANVALRTGLVMDFAGKPPSRLCDMILANLGAQVIPMVGDQKDIVCEPR